MRLSSLFSQQRTPGLRHDRTAGRPADITLAKPEWRMWETGMTPDTSDRGELSGRDSAVAPPRARPGRPPMVRSQKSCHLRSRHVLVRPEPDAPELKAGDRIVASDALYGRTAGLIGGPLSALGVQATFFVPLTYGILPDHLRTDEIVAANARIQAGTFIRLLIGTIAGGLLILPVSVRAMVSARSRIRSAALCMILQRS